MYLCLYMVVAKLTQKFHSLVLKSTDLGPCP